MKFMYGREDKTIYSGFVVNDAFQACEKVRTIVAGIENAVGLNSDQSFDVRVILSELLQNAITHGCPLNSQQKVYMNVCVSDTDILSITVKDQGNGFDASKVMQDEQSRKTCERDDLMESGRGLQIVKNLCDDMVFNHNGNSITVRKRLI